MRYYYGASSWWYGIQGAYAHEQYVRGYYSDIDRYWADYIKNTGFTPKYPYKVGMRYDRGAFDYSRKAIYDSYKQLTR